MFQLQYCADNPTEMNSSTFEQAFKKAKTKEDERAKRLSAGTLYDFIFGHANGTENNIDDENNQNYCEESQSTLEASEEELNLEGRENVNGLDDDELDEIDRLYDDLSDNEPIDLDGSNDVSFNQLKSLSLEQLKKRIEKEELNEKNKDLAVEKLKNKQKKEIQRLEMSYLAKNNELENKQKAELERITKKHTEQKTKLKEEKNLKIRSLVNKHKDQLSANVDKFDGIANKKVKLQEGLQSRLGSVLPKAASLIPECYVCLERMEPPVEIMHCTNGHLVCSACFPNLRVKVCGQCNAAIIGRATAMEQMVRQILNVQ